MARQAVTGKVKWWNEKKGWGFITPDDGGDDVFVHYTGIEGSGHRNLIADSRVEFEHASDHKKRDCATNVRVI